MDVQLLPERKPSPSQAQARFTVVGVIGGGCDDCIFLEPCECESYFSLQQHIQDPL